MRTGLLMLLAAEAMMGQTFEVASVKPVGQERIRPLHGGPGTSSPGELSGGATLRTLIMRAYGLKDYQIAGPAWMDSDRYRVAARIPAGADRPAVGRMLQALLTERFHLETRRERREMRVYSLTVAKNGPKLRESGAARDENAAEGPVAPKMVRGTDGLPDLQPGTDVPRSFEIVMAGSDGILYKLWARRESMADLADRLTAALSRAVVDRTGLGQEYDFTLTWSVESAGGVIPRTGPPPDEIESHGTPVLTDPGLSVFSAVREQLGLALRPGKAEVEVLVVTRAQRVPVGN
jgi:uncharacterized protein (TIGR03435 family)